MTPEEKIRLVEDTLYTLQLVKQRNEVFEELTKQKIHLLEALNFRIDEGFVKNLEHCDRRVFIYNEVEKDISKWFETEMAPGIIRQEKNKLDELENHINALEKAVKIYRSRIFRALMNHKNSI